MSRKLGNFVRGSLLAGILLAGSPARAGGLRSSVDMTGDHLASAPDAACNSTLGPIVAADPNQLCAIVVNIGANAARVGDSNCSASRCAQVAANGTATICTTAEIDCYSAAGTTFSITKVMR